ncbi:MAG: peptidase M3 [Candidatus Neomarinimicrobiota bacterium]|nr:MAG: peptidase M3 [Candidatus Neomarinimicrobiota bacterium]
MKSVLTTFSLFALAVLVFGCAPNMQEKKLQAFIDEHVETVKPLAKAAALAYWEAAISGKPEDYERTSELTLEVRQIYSDRSDFEFLRDIKKSGRIRDPLLNRQLQVLYYAYLENQMDPDLLKQIVDLSTEIEKKFSTFRGTIDGRKVTDNQIKQILKSSTDSAERKKAWLASKQVGPVVASDLIRLVKLRNQAARKLGFDNYHTMSLTISEQDVKEIDGIFEELYKLTNVPYAKVKAELDRRLADKYGISARDLMPWHYHDPFFQETPMVYELDLDVYYEGKDLRALAETFYAGVGLPVESILAKSDLYEREGKNPHAFCTHIDRAGDVRILCNLKSNETWMETLLHELGHGVYDKYLDFDSPYILREPAHAFTTEAIAMFFGRLSRNPAWMQQMLGLSDEQRAEIEKVSGKYAQLKQLIFARWAMVMYNFEKQLYADPDQDLNKLWWDMVEKYQLVNRPVGRDEPDWAAKIHFSAAPCYYHNYMLGELLASQLHHALVQNVLKLASDEDVSYVGREKAGRFLRENVFEAGDKYHWNEMIARATGEPLTARYFVDQFVQ